jgi:hypothetical protein
VISPNLAGFREAQERKRALLGEDIVFISEPVFVWPDVPIDEQTGRPYDPTVVPLSSAAASAVVRCGVAFRGTITGATEVGAQGVVDRTHVMLIASSGAASAVEGKSRFQARGETFLIESTKFDGVSGIDRLLVYGARV